ncbi:GIY-YIG nuclease family protein [Aequorivita sp. SDUM287046]|uniref:Excinuclease cho n=1 Tax=Aequorivita aurantiaca TaxID=3053356 RepID=A0ABT8DMJ5_9FLAO|nr:GIY-YIG nuclease family protein [Aequorivita aurantiaca]MDN3725110.1 GIY-YIG nuclease family protein [Aequorivita aurantiaca]
MNFSFVSVKASSNNIKTARLLQVTILAVEDGDVIGKFESYIKPVPRLTFAERNSIPAEYSKIKSASAFCDVAIEMIPLLENGQTIFVDRFSERIFIKSFREIGYPVGRATYLLQQIFKKRQPTTVPFTLPYALQSLNLKMKLDTCLEECRAMKQIFFDLLERKTAVAEMPTPICRREPQVDFSMLPTTPGVYFFRNKEGEVLYVGKAVNILKRVRSHFSATQIFERELCEQTASVDFEETGNDTLALLLESHYITTLKPPLNTSQKELINPYIITSKMDSKGILRVQLVQKSYVDSENEFYYNRESVLKKMLEVQRKFGLCRRFTGIERSASQCSDKEFCRGICIGDEGKDIYNSRVQQALDYIVNERPSYILKLKGRNSYESACILVKQGIYQGFGFIGNEEQINSVADIEGYIKKYAHNYFTSRIIDQYFCSGFRMDNCLIV